MKTAKNKSEESLMKNTKLSMRIMAGVMVALMFFGVVAGVLIYLI